MFVLLPLMTDCDFDKIQMNSAAQTTHILMCLTVVGQNDL